MFSSTTTAGSGTTITAVCGASFPIIIGGGFTGLTGGGNSQYVTDSAASGPSAWTVTVATSDAGWSVIAYCSK